MLGITAAAHVSDAGNKSHTGTAPCAPRAKPPTPRPPIGTIRHLVQNDLDQRINRDAISAVARIASRRPAPLRPRWTTPAETKKRMGFMVPCSTSRTCYSRCGEHPLTGFRTSARQSAILHLPRRQRELDRTDARRRVGCAESAPGIPVSSDFGDQQTRLAILEARPTWIPKPDTVSTQSYFVDEPGENKFDPPAGSSYGVCTDVRMDFMHSNCESRAGPAPSSD